MIDRRTMMGSAAALAAVPIVPALASAMASTASAATGASLSGPFIDLTTPMGNVEAFARLNGNVDPNKVSYSWYTGRMAAVRPGEAARDLMGVIGMGTTRLLPRIGGGPGYLMLRKELGFFTDLETGEIMDEWRNPFTDEVVTVDHIANPSINAEIKPQIGGAGLYEETMGDEPFLLPWKLIGGRAIAERHAHLYVPNPLDPAIWKRESSGKVISISDSQTYNAAIEDLQNPALTKVDSFGHWVHRRPWQPWMFMGQAEGFIEYNCSTGTASSLDMLPADMVAKTRADFPGFLIGATEVTKAESSLARYMRTRTPASLPEAAGAER